VTAKDKGSGKEQSISITGASTLSDNEVERMVKDAESNSAADKEKREKIDLKNQAETLIYQSEKQLSELGDKVGAEDKAKVEQFSSQLKEAVANDDTATMKTVLEQLQQALYSAGAAVYQNAGATAGAPGGNGSSGNGAGSAPSADDVIDAEFTESK
jgi:molecular chaperone DnaK